jgi:hypothetical protein
MKRGFVLLLMLGAGSTVCQGPAPDAAEIRAPQVLPAARDGESPLPGEPVPEPLRNPGRV